MPVTDIAQAKSRPCYILNVASNAEIQSYSEFKIFFLVSKWKSLFIYAFKLWLIY